VVDSDDDPDYGVAVDYDVKLGIFGKWEVEELRGGFLFRPQF
jgi:hypothetical protein